MTYNVESAEGPAGSALPAEDALPVEDASPVGVSWGKSANAARKKNSGGMK